MPIALTEAHNVDSLALLPLVELERWVKDTSVGIEHWDESRGRWVLYRSEVEHSEDCEAHPYDCVPRRIFLDTNVVNLLVDYSEYIFEHQLLPPFADEKLAEDVEALMHVFYVGARAYWSILASRKTLDEIGNTPDPARRDLLKAFAIELIDPDDEANIYASIVGRRMIDAPFTEGLPDQADRELIGNAVGLGCDVFCTRDRRTIVRKRELLRLLPIRVMTPREWWEHVRPWAGLCM